jgi:hypothetical protein
MKAQQQCLSQAGAAAGAGYSTLTTNGRLILAAIRALRRWAPLMTRALDCRSVLWS